MGSLSRWAVRSPLKAIAAWLAMAILAGIAAGTLGGTYNNSFDLPATESTKAQELLGEIPGIGDSFNVATAKIVWKSDSVLSTDPSVAGPLSEMFNEIAALDSVDCVVSPYALGTEVTGVGDKCPPASPAPQIDATQIPAKTLKVMAGLAQSGFSVDQKVAYGTVLFNTDVTNVPTADAKALLDAIKATAAAGGCKQRNINIPKIDKLAANGIAISGSLIT